MLSRIILIALTAAYASCALVPMSFTALEEATGQKIVIFHDPSVAKSRELHALMVELDDSGKYGSEYQFTVCDVTTSENKKPVEEAGFKKFPRVFSQTAESGIEGWDGEFTRERFEEFHAFRKKTITNDKVRVLRHASGGTGDIAASELGALARRKPVLVKMFEQWCTHCKKMKKHFQHASNQLAAKAAFVEVECSKCGDFCTKLGAKGFPTVKLLWKNQVAKYEGRRTHNALRAYISGGASAWDALEPLTAEQMKLLGVREGEEEEEEEQDDEDDGDDDDDGDDADGADDGGIDLTKLGAFKTSSPPRDGGGDSGTDAGLMNEWGDNCNVWVKKEPELCNKKPYKKNCALACNGKGAGGGGSDNKKDDQDSSESKGKRDHDPASAPPASSECSTALAQVHARLESLEKNMALVIQKLDGLLSK